VEAKLYLGKAKKIAPNNAAVGWNIARLSLKERKPLEALNVARDTSRRFPDDVEGMGVLGACLRANGEVVESLKVLNRAIELNSDYAEAFVSRGLIRLGQENKAEALSDLELAHRLKPHIKQIWDLVIGLKLEMQDYSDAILILINMIDLDPENEKLLTALALCYQHLEDFDSAIGAYKKALSVKPDNVVVQTNLGSALKQKGKLDEAIEAYSKALTIKPDYAEAKHNLAEILKIYSPKNNNHNPLIDLDNKIKTKHNKHMLPKIDQELAAYTLNLLNELQSADKNLSTEYLQIYRRNTVDLNCKRHKQIFKEKEIIPRFCFGCYKVQVDVTTVLDLIRLAALFYESEFESDLTRKCLVEVRPNIPGSYKGLIYCRGIDQAHSVKTQLDVQVRDIDKNLVTKIKKGCSEFPLAFPEYGEVAASEELMLQYPQAWRALEVEFDEKSSSHQKLM
jgi:tetratricopeptide (TPR) repeat protein